MKFFLSLVFFAVSFQAVSADQPAPPRLVVSVEIPRLKVSEYHRPYVAVWVQDEERKVVANLAVWYQLTGSAEGEGTKWLPDLRQWWRRSGRSLNLPVDGVSSATLPVGKHELKFAADDKRLAQFLPGQYELVIEAAREVGGRELITIPFVWPASEAVQRSKSGETELAEVSLTINP